MLVARSVYFPRVHWLWAGAAGFHSLCVRAQALSQVIVHLEDGKVTRIVWDDGCSMCPSGDELECLRDNTSTVVSACRTKMCPWPVCTASLECTPPHILHASCDILAPVFFLPQCYSGGAAVACTDCYVSVGSTCGPGSISCTPRVHVAWMGTDRLGRPLTSAGSILSKFRSYSLNSLSSQLYSRVNRWRSSSDTE